MDFIFAKILDARNTYIKTMPADAIFELPALRISYYQKEGNADTRAETKRTEKEIIFCSPSAERTKIMDWLRRDFCNENVYGAGMDTVPEPATPIEIAYKDFSVVVTYLDKQFRTNEPTWNIENRDSSSIK